MQQQKIRNQYGFTMDNNITYIHKYATGYMLFLMTLRIVSYLLILMVDNRFQNQWRGYNFRRFQNAAGFARVLLRQRSGLDNRQHRARRQPQLSQAPPRPLHVQRLEGEQRHLRPLPLLQQRYGHRPVFVQHPAARVVPDRPARPVCAEVRVGHRRILGQQPWRELRRPVLLEAGTAGTLRIVYVDRKQLFKEFIALLLNIDIVRVETYIRHG